MPNPSEVSILAPIRSPLSRRLQNLSPYFRSRYRSLGKNRAVPTMPVPTALVVQKTTRTGTGIIPTFIDIHFQGDTFVNSANAVIQVLNNSGQSVTISVIGEQACNQGYFHNYILTIPSGQGLPAEMGPFDFHYNDNVAVVHISYSFNSGIVPGVTIAVVSP